VISLRAKKQIKIFKREMSLQLRTTYRVTSSIGTIFTGGRPAVHKAGILLAPAHSDLHVIDLSTGLVSA
jgi:hypothetical protein